MKSYFFKSKISKYLKIVAKTSKDSWTIIKIHLVTNKKIQAFLITLKIYLTQNKLIFFILLLDTLHNELSLKIINKKKLKN